MLSTLKRQISLSLVCASIIAACQGLTGPQVKPQITIARGMVGEAYSAADMAARAEAQLRANRSARLVRLMIVRKAVQLAIQDGEHAAASEALKPREEMLLIGDSMAWALGVELKPRMEAAGHKFKFIYKVSDSVRAWQRTKASPLKDAIRKHPSTDVVIIVLGSNDYMYPRSERLRGTLELVNALLGTRRCFWVGPPMWRKDNGIVAFLEEASDPCQFFNSSALTLKRRADGIHPNRAGSRDWAEAVYRWIKRPATTVSQQP